MDFPDGAECQRASFTAMPGGIFTAWTPHWGTLADLQHMVQAAHARGMLVIDDIVVNHGGDLIDSRDSGYRNFGAPRRLHPALPQQLEAISAAVRHLQRHHTRQRAHQLVSQQRRHPGLQRHRRRSVLGELSGLDDFRTESTYVREHGGRYTSIGLGRPGFDGFRIDTVKHVEMGFWQNWCPAGPRLCRDAREAELLHVRRGV